MSYIWCGRDGWCYASNVLDVFTKQWLGFAFDTRATRHAAIMSITNAVAARSPDPGELTIRADNGPSIPAGTLGDPWMCLRQGWSTSASTHHSQNGHIESFHKTLKKEYV